MSRQSARRRPPPPRRTASSPPQVVQDLSGLPGAGYATTIPGIAILPLRLFLGITFLYAGWQKITDPGFFRIGSTTYIGTQLRNFAHSSPIQPVFQHMLEHAVAIGWLTIFTEMAVGVCVLLGLFTRLASLVGLTLNFLFFLSASWGVYPYFLGSDIVFAICWLTLAIAGPGAYYLDAMVAPPLRRYLSDGIVALLLGPSDPLRVRAAGVGTGVAPMPTPRMVERSRILSRGEALAAGVGAVVLVLLGLAPRPSLGGGAASSSPAGSQSPTSPTPAPTSGAGGPPAGAKLVGNVSQIPANSALATTDPKSGDPAVVVHTTGNDFVCYDAVCTHAGCTVQYDSQYRVLVCPCHGGAFDPAHGAQVIAGPPPSPLQQLPITIDSKGDIYLA